jgi:hypothetical protein
MIFSGHHGIFSALSMEGHTGFHGNSVLTNPPTPRKRRGIDFLRRFFIFRRVA